MKHKICDNCGAVMTYDEEIEGFRCLICGNSDEVSEDLNKAHRSYIE